MFSKKSLNGFLIIIFMGFIFYACNGFNVHAIQKKNETIHLSTDQIKNYENLYHINVKLTSIKESLPNNSKTNLLLQIVQNKNSAKYLILVNPKGKYQDQSFKVSQQTLNKWQLTVTPLLVKESKSSLYSLIMYIGNQYQKVYQNNQNEISKQNQQQQQHNDCLKLIISILLIAYVLSLFYLGFNFLKYDSVTGMPNEEAKAIAFWLYLYVIIISILLVIGIIVYLFYIVIIEPNPSTWRYIFS